MARRKVQYEGREVDGTDVAFNIVKDGAVVLECEDGSRVRVKPVIINVIKTDEKVQGERLYIVQHFVQVALDTPPPEDLE